MIRAMTAEDAAEVIEVVVAADMFTADEVPFLEEMLSGYEAAARDEGHVAVVVDEGPMGVAGVAYYRPKEAADRVWDLTMIAVHPQLQGRGTGRGLMRHVEADLAARGARLLAVRTSGTGQYAGTRAFYARCGYDRVAEVPDWWTDGDDLVLFTRRLADRSR